MKLTVKSKMNTAYLVNPAIPKYDGSIYYRFKEEEHHHLSGLFISLSEWLSGCNIYHSMRCDPNTYWFDVHGDLKLRIDIYEGAIRIGYSYYCVDITTYFAEFPRANGFIVIPFDFDQNELFTRLRKFLNDQIQELQLNDSHIYFDWWAEPRISYYSCSVPWNIASKIGSVVTVRMAAKEIELIKVEMRKWLSHYLTTEEVSKINFKIIT